MQFRISPVWRILLVLVCGPLAGPGEWPEAGPWPTGKMLAGGASPIRVMSFNIRYGTAPDAANHWRHREELVAAAIQQEAPDLLGVQEALAFQCEFLRSHLPDHGFVGRGREADASAGEFCAVFFRKDRFQLVDEGHFWLSEQPETAGSRSWDSSLPRMVTWVRLRDRQTNNREFVFANTHFDHRGAEARAQAARLIRQRLSGDPDSLPLILTGDFNCDEESPAWGTLAGDDSAGGPLQDTYRVAHPERATEEGTFSAWTGQTDGPRIDWILCSPSFQVRAARIDRWNQGGQYPSDHYPVTAVLQWRAD